MHIQEVEEGVRYILREGFDAQGKPTPDQVVTLKKKLGYATAAYAGGDGSGGLPGPSEGDWRVEVETEDGQTKTVRVACLFPTDDQGN